MMRRSPTPHRPRALVVTVLLALVAAAAGCGVPTDGAPRAITAESTTTPPAESSAGPASGDAAIYLSTPTDAAPEAETRLEAVPRNLGAPPNPTNILQALFEGPTEQEQDRNLFTLIPDGTTLVTTDFQEGLLTVELSDEWSAQQGPDQVGAYAQVVLSVTGLDEVTSVRFGVDGEPIDDVPNEGDPKTTVTRGDYIGMITPGG